MRSFGVSLSACLLSVTAGQSIAETACSNTSDKCTGTYSSLVAIAHDYNAPADFILYRVKLPENATTTSWGDGSNGFFYRVSLDGQQTWQNWVPFNGVGSDSSGAPTLRPFSFVVKAPVAATSLVLAACASNYTPVTVNGTEPDCTKTLWHDIYSSLPAPAVEPSPLGLFTLEALDKTVQVRNNGVYAAPIELEPQQSGVPAKFTEAQIEWLYDHLVFLDSDNNVYTNNVFADSAAAPSFAALGIEEAAFQTSPTSGAYRAKFAKVEGAVKPIDPSVSPNRRFWVYSTNTGNVNSGQAIKVAVKWLYDASQDCLGALSGDTNSNDPKCQEQTGTQPDDGGGLEIEMTVYDGSELTFSAVASDPPGGVYSRGVSLGIKDGLGLCTVPVNPLAVRTSGTQNLLNYVISRRTASTDTWTAAFPQALYYVLPAGLGNCGKAEAPFCARTADYTGYIPAYLDASQTGGTANGNSTTAWTLGSANGSLTLFDQYQLAPFAQSGTSSNTLIWFDNCGYGHEFVDTNAIDRLKLPPANLPGGFPVFDYQIKNSLAEPVTFAKTCCATLYQEACTTNENNQQECSLVPPQQLGTSVNDTVNANSGMYVGPGETVSYATLFSDEIVEAYNAVTGDQLFKMRLLPPRPSVTKAGAPAVYACADPNAKVALTGSGSNFTLDLGSTAATALACTAGNPQDLCPWPMYAGTGTGALAGYTSCTIDNYQHSSIALDVAGWAGQRLNPNQAVTLMAAGPFGSGGQSKDFGNGGLGGPGGFALSVLKGSDLASIPALYVYIGTKAPAKTQGGSSTIVSKRPMTSLSDTDRETAKPGNDVYLVAGGGAAGGDGSKNFFVYQTNGGDGGTGGIACANTSTNPNDVSAAGGSGAYVGCTPCGRFLCTPGAGGNRNLTGGGGTGGSGGQNGTEGIGGEAAGTGWLQSGSLVINTLNTGKGSPTQHYGGAGGGGYGGGGAGGACNNSGSAGSGGGGGGSFAIKNTAYEPNVPTTASCYSLYGNGFDTGIFQLYYTGEAIAYRGYLSTPSHPQPTQCLPASTSSGTVLRSSSNWALNWGSDGTLSLVDDKAATQFKTDSYGSTAELCFQGSDGNLVINVGNGTPWSTGIGGARLAFDGPCNVSLLDATDKTIWTTATSCS